jgi:hypothetical protein
LSCEKLEILEMPWNEVNFENRGPVEESLDHRLELNTYDGDRPLCFCVPDLSFNTQAAAERKLNEIRSTHRPEQVANATQLAT